MTDYVVGGYGDEYDICVDGPNVTIGSGCAQIDGCTVWNAGEVAFLRPYGGVFISTNGCLQ